MCGNRPFRPIIVIENRGADIDERCCRTRRPAAAWRRERSWLAAGVCSRTTNRRFDTSFNTAGAVWGTPQFDLPADAIGNPSAGVISSIVGTLRQVQFALRLSF
jgi:hypothetical protein